MLEYGLLWTVGWLTIKTLLQKPHKSPDTPSTPHIGGCQNYGPILEPYYNTAPNICCTQNGTKILITAYILQAWGEMELFEAPASFDSSSRFSASVHYGKGFWIIMLRINPHNPPSDKHNIGEWNIWGNGKDEDYSYI